MAGRRRIRAAALCLLIISMLMQQTAACPCASPDRSPSRSEVLAWPLVRPAPKPNARAPSVVVAARPLNPSFQVLDPFGPSWAWLERLAEVLRLAHHPSILKFHDADDVNGMLVIA